MKYKKYWRKTSLKQKNIGNLFLNEVTLAKPKKFLEIGIFKGVTARNICELLYKIHDNNFKYIGVDKFDLDEKTNNEILPNNNFKNPLQQFYYQYIIKENPYSLKSVKNFLKKFDKNIDIFNGDSKVVLPKIDLSDIDYVFLDGGHSYDTVINDLINCKVVVENIKYVTKVIPQYTLDYVENLNLIKPNYVVHGDDWKNGVQKKTRDRVVKTLKKWSGKLIEPKYTKNISSTEIKNKISNILSSPENRISRLKNLKREFSKAFAKADTVVLCPIYKAGENINLGFKYSKFAKELIKNSKIKVILIQDNLELAKFIRQNIYGDKIVIGMGTGSISNLSSAVLQISLFIVPQLLNDLNIFKYFLSLKTIAPAFPKLPKTFMGLKLNVPKSP